MGAPTFVMVFIGYPYFSGKLDSGNYFITDRPMSERIAYGFAPLERWCVPLKLK